MNSKWSRCVEKGKLKKGPWTFEEDIRLLRYIRTHGDGRWTTLAKAAGLQRCGKSCRLRWVNYLRPGIKRGNITAEEERIIIDLHARWGNRWSLIAERIPGRTDNEIKNYWRSHLKKKLQKSAQTGDQKSTSGTTQPLAMSQVQAKQQNLEVFTVINAIEPSYEDNFDHGVVKVDNLQDMKTDIDQLHCLYTQSPFLGNSEGMGIGMAGQDADELAPMFHSLPWGIPIESDAGAIFEASYSANGGGLTELYGAADGCESDTGADIMLWNMCPIPNMELDTPFLSAPRPLGHVNGQTPFPPFSVN